MAAKPESDTAAKLKKNVKRLQATKQAVKHAMQLLVPDLAKNEVGCTYAIFPAIAYLNLLFIIASISGSQIVASAAGNSKECKTQQQTERKDKEDQSSPSIASEELGRGELSCLKTN